MGWKAKRGNSAAGYHRECYSKFTNKTSIERAIVQSGKAQLVLQDDSKPLGDEATETSGK
jgi:hypothetical protein